jgi:hypothetical protein
MTEYPNNRFPDGSKVRVTDTGMGNRKYLGKVLYGTKAEADAMMLDIEKLSALEGTSAPDMLVERDPNGGWNLWLWEQ